MFGTFFPAGYFASSYFPRGVDVVEEVVPIPTAIAPRFVRVIPDIHVRGRLRLDAFDLTGALAVTGGLVQGVGVLVLDGVVVQGALLAVPVSVTVDSTLSVASLTLKGQARIQGKPQSPPRQRPVSVEDEELLEWYVEMCSR